MLFDIFVYGKMKEKRGNKMTCLDLIIKAACKIYRETHRNSHNFWDESRVELFGRDANEYIINAINNADNGLMISKFGTIELNSVCCTKRLRDGVRVSDYVDLIKGKGTLTPEIALKYLCNNAGFFPFSLELQNRFMELVLEDVKEIDILGSYVDQETYLEKELEHCKKIDIYSYCAPFAYDNPWTTVLKNKKVLVVHPFTQSIRKQYENRNKLFDNPNVLPEFEELILVKAIQSIAGNGYKSGFKDWFEALKFMEEEIDSHDYDIALIGCGAYGMSLAAHCKRQGKIAVHMASWVQMLFGIYGQRWAVDQPQYAKFINEHWTRPMESEKPENAESVENGAYW